MSPTSESFPPVPGVVRLLAPLQLRLAHESGLATAGLTRPSDWCRPGRRDPASALGPRRRRTARELGRATAVLAGRLDAAFEAVLAAPEDAREAAADGYRRALAALAAHLMPMGHGARRASPTQQALQLVRTAPLVVPAPIDVDADAGAASCDLAGEIRRHVNAGEGFEESAAWAAAAGGEGAGTGGEARARAIAFYLPQFHAFAENDAWWGTGFSEWRNVCRGTPRFVGHYQPRVPRDLGFYDLTNEATLHAQAALARANGIAAFCFYHYWFDGKRLMERPLDLFVEAGVEQEFCLMWANENWTRTWDGLESEVLIEQTYREEDEAGFIADTARYMTDERYVRVAGRPLFIVYRPGLLPESRKTLARWRRLWTEAVGAEPWLLMVQGFEDEDPRVHGLDGAVEFPPHKVCKDLAPINAELEVLDPAFAGHVLDYEAVVERSLGEGAVEFPLVKTVVPHWDNDARREGRGLTLHGSSPARYERWLRGATGYARANRFGGEALVFVNAWNEWAEGAYLEPDVHWGHAYLNATRRARARRAGRRGARRAARLVARDADAAAAPGGHARRRAHLARALRRRRRARARAARERGRARRARRARPHPRAGRGGGGRRAGRARRADERRRSPPRGGRLGVDARPSRARGARARRAPGARRAARRRVARSRAAGRRIARRRRRVRRALLGAARRAQARARQGVGHRAELRVRALPAGTARVGVRATPAGVRDDRARRRLARRQRRRDPAGRERRRPARAARRQRGQRRRRVPPVAARARARRRHPRLDRRGGRSRLPRLPRRVRWPRRTRTPS